MRQVLSRAGIDRLIQVPQGLQVVARGEAIFVTNHTASPITLSLPVPVAKTYWGHAAAGQSVTLPGFGFSWLQLRWPQQDGKTCLPTGAAQAKQLVTSTY